MIIREEDFEATQISEGSTFWDLKIIKTKKKRDGTITEEFGDTIYGIPLDSVMKRVAISRIGRKHKEQAITMKQFLDEWKVEMNKLQNLSLNEYEK